MIDNHSFCRTLLSMMRIDAKAYNVKIPKGLVALESFRGQWFVQGKCCDAGAYVNGDCAYEARANYIQKLIHDEYPQLAEETE